MRPLTADDVFLTIPRVIRPSTRTPKALTVSGTRQIHNLLSTNNVNSFMGSSSINLDSATLNSVKALAKTEVATELTHIKSKINATHRHFSINDSTFKDLTQTLRSQSLESKAAFSKASRLQSMLQYFQKSIDNIVSQQESCEHDMQTYVYILHRCKASQFFLEKKAMSYNKRLNTARFIAEVEQKMGVRTREARACSQRVYRTLQDVAQVQRKGKKAVFERYSKDFELRDLIVDRREQRRKRYQEISEFVENAEQDKRLGNLREGVLLHKAWAGVLQGKLNSAMKKSAYIELAFQKIRAVTGEANVNELVQKFLTREETFKELKSMIGLSRVSIDMMNEKNSEIEKVIGRVETLDKESKAAEIFRLKEKAGDWMKEIENERIILKEVKGVYVHINEWAVRIMRLLGMPTKEKDGLKLIFQDISEFVCKRLESIKNQSDII